MITTMRVAAIAALICQAGLAVAATADLETRWTKAAIADYTRIPAAEQQKRVLPEVRVYDAHHQLILRTFGNASDSIVSRVEGAIRARKRIAGPSFAQSLGELETRDGQPAISAVGKASQITVIDYWAEWCAPCKAIGKDLAAWVQRQPAGSVRLVRAETDLIAALHPGVAVEHKFLDPQGRPIAIPPNAKITMTPDGKVVIQQPH